MTSFYRKKTGLSLLRRLTLAFLLFGILDSSYASASCRDQLHKISRKHDYLTKVAGGNVFTAIWVLTPITGPVALAGWAIPTTLVVVRARNTNRALYILNAAEVMARGTSEFHFPNAVHYNGLKKFWKKVRKKHPHQTQNLTLEEFAARLHEADESGELCATRKVPLKKQFLEVALD